MLVRNADIRSAEVIKRTAHLDFPSIAEIGVFEGEMSRRLLYRINLHLLMVDPWGNAGGYDDPMGQLTHEEWENVWSKAHANVAWAADRVRMFHGTSQAAADHFGDRFDLVFIDADHSYDGALRDIRLWWPKIAVDGWLSGHDYRADQGGVIEAVNDFASSEGVDIALGDNMTWFIRKC